MVRYLLEVSEHATREGVVGMLRSVLGAKADEVIMTVGQQLIEQGRQKGLEQGLEQGERKILLRQLERRFGHVPESIVARVSVAAKGELERWADQILQAKTLDDVFA